ncbi:hypothetical protein B9T62_00465 [Paenibacillus donghaensis]|uniref:HTH tetR-type domain-containing protein n=1 Tax=Paenibacillus donghaensis TaxID=414771 RepID=A0A2Z2KH47_9BACL|nr:hypothetical protein B9T62_00465 [Paenibacillus donghaensis]
MTVNEVCAAAKVSKGSLYHHFDSKDELFLYIVEADTVQWLQEWEVKQQGIADIEQRFYALAEHYANDFQNPLIRALEEFSRSKEHADEITERLSQLYDMSLQAFRSLLSEGIAAGYLLDGSLEDYVIIVCGLMEGVGKVSELSLLTKQPMDIQRYHREAIRLLLLGLRAGPEK